MPSLQFFLSKKNWALLRKTIVRECDLTNFLKEWNKKVYYTLCLFFNMRISAKNNTTE